MRNKLALVVVPANEKEKSLSVDLSALHRFNALLVFQFCGELLITEYKTNILAKKVARANLLFKVDHAIV